MSAQKRFRVHYRYRAWIGKPDPHDHGTAYIAADDYSWLQEYMIKLRNNGHQVIRVQRFENGQYITI